MALAADTNIDATGLRHDNDDPDFATSSDDQHRRYALVKGPVAGGQALTLVGGRKYQAVDHVFVGAAAPAAADVADGDIWVDTTDPAAPVANQRVAGAWTVLA